MSTVGLVQRRDQDTYQLLPHLPFRCVYWFIRGYGLIFNRQNNIPEVIRPQETRNFSSIWWWSDRVQVTEDTIRVKISEFCILDNSIMGKALGKRRRRREKISVLYRFYWRRNSVPSSCSMSFRRTSSWSVFSRPRWIFHQHTLYYCFRIDCGRQNASRQRQTVLFTVVDLIAKHRHEQKEFDLTKSRLTDCKQKWKAHQDGVYWVNIRFAQRKGLTFFFFFPNKVKRNYFLRHSPIILSWKGDVHKDVRRPFQ